jgi:hypothetical protein
MGSILLKHVDEKIDGTYASELFFVKCSRENWNWDDFPDVRPKNRYTWIEFKAPEASNSSEYGIIPWVGCERWAWAIR